MHVGLIVQLHGAPGRYPPPPTWESVRTLAQAAETAGFDSFVFEDALLYRGVDSTAGVWESVSFAGALSAATSRIRIGHSVINSPYRSPAMTAKIAETLDEISGGRYVFGIGAGNTPDSDYEAFGFPTDKRYSRFEEAIEIIHGLLKTGAVDFSGKYHSAHEAELVLRGPRGSGPPIIIAAGGPKMIRLAARFADEWNWWTSDAGGEPDSLQPLLDEMDNALAEAGRDPASLRRSLDVYSVMPLPGNGIDADRKMVTGPVAALAETILGLGDLGFDEVRCDVQPKTVAAVEMMAEVIDLVHRDGG